MIEKVLVLFSIIFLFSNQQYQQCNHHSGNLLEDQDQIFGSTGVFHEDNSFGGISDSLSFLSRDESEIYVFFGSGSIMIVDQFWKYSISKSQWAFIKGRRERGKSSIVNELNIFDEENQIGARMNVKGWKTIENGTEIVFFWWIWKCECVA